MAKGYWVVNVEVSDPTAYKAYQAAVGPFLAASGGRFVVRGGTMEVAEGTVGGRVVVVEFPSLEQATRAYHSAEYGEIRMLRADISVANFAIVEGFDG